ncbi:hypothetical protein [Zobellella sp. An-6]|uniref:hypothetical protein n=1 Tax=Zobellella sp. An-6 TaxID=3400218 RepID=UPI004042AD62
MTRTFLALIITFFVAFQGIAAPRVAMLPCPMEHEQPASPMAMSAEDHHCCNDADTQADTGEPCKTDMPCGSSGSCLFAPVNLTASPPPATEPAGHPLLQLRSREPSSVWRPPSIG